nr:hypothetical protein Iba_chr10bCG10270 [Ipomoea batatas]
MAVHHGSNNRGIRRGARVVGGIGVGAVVSGAARQRAAATVFPPLSGISLPCSRWSHGGSPAATCFLSSFLLSMIVGILVMVAGDEVGGGGLWKMD